MDKHVLVIADKEDDDFLSLEKAHDVAIDISASLEIIKFIQHDAKSPQTLDDHIAQVEHTLNQAIERIFESSAEITSKVIVHDHIDDWVVERCEMANAKDNPKVDLVIKGGHRTESLFHKPTDWKLIRHLHCPILIASHHKWKSKANILMTLDLAHDDQRHQSLNELTLTWGNTWAKATHTELHALYCIPIAQPLLELDLVDTLDVEEKKGPAAKEKMQTLLAQHEISDVTSHIAAGCPKKVISHVADELHSDVVIIGCFGHEGINGFLQGNTAEKVMHHLRTDCLIVKLPKD